MEIEAGIDVNQLETSRTGSQLRRCIVHMDDKR